MRELMNAIFYVLRSGCLWRTAPANFAPYSAVYRWFVRSAALTRAVVYRS
jgi:transposase